MPTNQVSKLTLQLGDSEPEDFELVDNNNPVIEVADTVTENTSNKTERHQFKETTADGTENAVSDFLIASNQISDLKANESGSGLNITQFDQSGLQTIKEIEFSSIKSNKTAIDSLYKPALVLVGDSWTQIANKAIETQLAKSYTVYNFGVSGSGWGNITEQLTNAAAAIPDPNLVKKILVITGVNDYFWGTNEYADNVHDGDIRDVRTAIETQFPNAVYYYVCSVAQTYATTPANDKLINIFYDQAFQRGFIPIHQMNYITLENVYNPITDDNSLVHPSDFGMFYIGLFINSVLNGTIFAHTSSKDGSFTASNNATINEQKFYFNENGTGFIILDATFTAGVQNINFVINKTGKVSPPLRLPSELSNNSLKIIPGCYCDKSGVHGICVRDNSILCATGTEDTNLRAFVPFIRCR